MNKKPFLLIFLFLSLFFLGVFVAPNFREEIHECDNIFLSGLYDRYRNGLKEFLDSQQINPLAPEASSRKSHEQFVRKLRKALSEKRVDYSPLIEWIYTAPSLTEPMQNFLISEALMVDSILGIEENFSLLLEKCRGDSRFKNNYGKSKNDDGFLHGNLPFYLYDYGNCKVIRMANQAKDLSFYEKFFTPPSKGVHEEFHSHIESFNRSGKKHLYINLMKRHGIEWKKTGLLERYEAISPGLVLVTLDKNSSFYMQTKGQTEDSAQFKKQFLEKIFDPKGNFYWSKKLDLDFWKKSCHEIVEKTHQEFFSEQTFFTVHEKKDFIEIAYLKIIESLIEQFNPELMNISCMKSMDRGPSLFSLFYASQKLKEGRKISEIQPELVTWLFATPLLVNNRPCHASRINRFVSALQRIEASRI